VAPAALHAVGDESSQHTLYRWFDGAIGRQSWGNEMYMFSILANRIEKRADFPSFERCPLAQYREPRDVVPLATARTDVHHYVIFRFPVWSLGPSIRGHV
jgi:hypothetical protein